MRVLRKLIAKRKIYIYALKKMILGSFEFAKNEGLIAEEGVSVMGGCEFGSEPYLIRLRKFCRISVSVTFITHDGGTWAFRNENERYAKVIKYGRIEIGEYSFVGANCTILPGVTIGDHCVIGACSLVNKDVPSGTVVAGVPAKYICTTEEYAEKCLSQMPVDYDERVFLENPKRYLIDYYMNND